MLAAVSEAVFSEIFNNLPSNSHTLASKGYNYGPCYKVFLSNSPVQPVLFVSEPEGFYVAEIQIITFIHLIKQSRDDTVKDIRTTDK